jgi:O-antigen/teichoic acid export membrane protein
MLIRSVLQVLTCNVASKAIMAAAGVLLIRWMSAAEFAQYVFILSIASLGAQTIGALFNRIFIVDTNHSKLAATQCISAQLWLCLLFCMVVCGIAVWQNLKFLLVVPLVFSMCLSDFAKSYFQRDLRFRHYSTIELTRSVAFLLGIGFFVRFSAGGLSVMQVIWLQAGSLLLITVVALPVRLIWDSIHRPLLGLRQLYALSQDRSIRALAGYFALLSIQGQLAILSLKACTDDFQCATLASALRYYGILQLALGASHTVIMPLLQRANSFQEIQAVLVRQRQMLLPFTMLIGVLVIVAGTVIPWIDGGKYPLAAWCFRILCLATLTGFITSPHVNVLVRMRDFQMLFRMLLAFVGVSILFTIGFVSAWGAIGGAMATVLSFSLSNYAVYRRSLWLQRYSAFAGERITAWPQKMAA